MKFKNYYESLFGIDIYWFRGSRKTYIDLVKGEFKQRAPEKTFSTKGTFEVYYKEKDNVWVGVIWLRNNNLSHLVHECLHAVHWSLLDKGLTLTDSSEETYAYFLEKLVCNIRGV